MAPKSEFFLALLRPELALTFVVTLVTRTSVFIHPKQPAATARMCVSVSLCSVHPLTELITHQRLSYFPPVSFLSPSPLCASSSQQSRW